MAATLKSNGNQAATLGTEHTLYETTDSGVYVLNVDLTNMLGNDITQLRVYKKIETGGPFILHQPPIPFGPTVPAGPLVATIPHDCLFGVRYTLEQTNGTGRSYKWHVTRLDA